MPDTLTAPADVEALVKRLRKAIEAAAGHFYDCEENLVLRREDGIAVLSALEHMAAEIARQQHDIDRQAATGTELATDNERLRETLQETVFWLERHPSEHIKPVLDCVRAALGDTPAGPDRQEPLSDAE